MPLHFRTMGDELKLLKNGQSSALRFNGPMTTDDIRELIAAVPELPKLKSVNLTGIGFTPEDFKALTDALVKHTGIQEIILNNNLIDKEKAAGLAEVIRANTGLRRLELAYCDMEDAALASVCGALASVRDLQVLNLNANKWQQNSREHLAFGIASQKNLCSLQIGREEENAPQEIFERALLSSPHPNLCTLNGVSSEKVISLIKRNQKARNDANHLLGDLSYAEVYPEQVGHTSPEAIRNIELRRPSIFHYTHNSDALDVMDDFIRHMPRLPDDAPLTVDALFSEDAHGVAPIENPHMWRDHPDMMNQLAEQKLLKSETLAKRTSRGVSLLDSALSYLPAKHVIAALNRQGQRLGKASLLQENGEASPLLHILHQKGEIKDLFTLDNWIGARHGELNALVNALPDTMKVTIPSLHRLKAALDSTAKDRSQIGR